MRLSCVFSCDNRTSELQNPNKSRKHIEVDQEIIKYITKESLIKFNTVAIFSLSKKGPMPRLTQLPFKSTNMYKQRLIILP